MFSLAAGTAVKRGAVVQSRGSNARMMVSAVNCIGSRATLFAPRALRWKAWMTEMPCGRPQTCTSTDALAQTSVATMETALSVVVLIIHSRRAGHLGLANAYASRWGQWHYRCIQL